MAEQSLPDDVPAINKAGFRLGHTVRMVHCAALCTCMLMLVPIAGCTRTMRSDSGVFFSVVTHTQESVFIKRRDLVDGRHYVEHPLLEQWKRHLNARENSTFTGWISKENIMRFAGTQTRPTGRQRQLATLAETADTYRHDWSPEPLSMFLLTNNPVSDPFDSVIPLEYSLTNLAQDGFVAIDQSRETTESVSGAFGGVLNGTRRSNQNYLELIFPVFGISFLICVLLTPALCSIGAQYIANPIRGSPHQKEAEMTIPEPHEEASTSDIPWLSDVLV